MTNEKFRECIDACQQCVIACNHCANACLHEEDVQQLSRCIRLDLECATFCSAAVQVMSINGKLSAELCELCSKICLLCAEECEKHDHMDHCRECALTCHKCAEVCGQ